MSGYPPYPPPPGQNPNDPTAWKYQRRILRDQARVQRQAAKAQRDLYRARVRGMRRRSIVGPLIVIALGIVFLLVQTGHLQAYRLWEWEGNWWPVLLVAIGVLLLVEWIFDQTLFRDPEHPYMRRTGGGVIFLLVLLAASGALFHAFHDEGRNLLAHHFYINPDNLDEYLGDRHDSDQSVDTPFPANTSLIVTSPRGDVTVSGTSPDNQIHITLHKQVFVRSDSEADTKAQQLQPLLTPRGNQIELSLPALDGAHADMVITLPASAPVTINASRGDVSVSSLKAPVTLTANHGDVELSSIAGTVVARINDNGSSFSAHNVTGPVSLLGRSHDVTLSDITGQASLDGEFFGDTHLEHINGPIHVHTSKVDLQLARLDGEVDISSGSGLSVEQAVGPFKLSTRNRNLTLERIAGEVSVSNTNGTVDLTSSPPLSDITVDNRNGSVNLTLPERASFHYEANTTDGDLESDFSTINQSSDHHSHSFTTGNIGSGGPTIRVTTSHGDIAFKKDSISPLPASPPHPPAPPSHGTNMDLNDRDSVVSIGKDGIRIIDGQEGNSVIVGKDGVRITKDNDGSRLLVEKDGTRITSTIDGNIVYVGKDGTRITRSSDGTRSYVGGDRTRLILSPDGTIFYEPRDGNRYTKSPDGTKIFVGRDGTHITISPDGHNTSTGSDGKPLSDSAMHDRLRRMEEDIQRLSERINSTLRSSQAASQSK